MRIKISLSKDSSVEDPSQSSVSALEIPDLILIRINSPLNSSCLSSTHPPIFKLSFKAVDFSSQFKNSLPVLPDFSFDTIASGTVLIIIMIMTTPVDINANIEF